MANNRTFKPKFEQMTDEQRTKYWNSFKLLSEMPAKRILNGVEDEIIMDTNKDRV